MDKSNYHDVMSRSQCSTSEALCGNTVFTVKEIQHILRIGQVNAYQLIQTPGFPVVKIGRAYRIPRDGFFRWLNSQQNSCDEQKCKGD